MSEPISHPIPSSPVSVARLPSALALLGAFAACTPNPGATDAAAHLSPPLGVCNHVAGEQAWARTELYFGTSMANGTLIPEEDYQRFLDTQVTARFGDGFTLLSGRGQFRGDDGAIVKEPSKLLILFYDFDERKSAAVDEIRNEFRQAFDQQSVLRVDAIACVAF